MKKKILAAALVMSMMFSAVACDDIGGLKDKSVDGSKVYKGTEYTSEVKLCDIKGLTVAESAATVTDEKVRETEYLLLTNTTYGALDLTNIGHKEGTVEMYDVVNIDYVGTVDGVEFEGGSAEGYELPIGSGTFIDGFEDGLIGVNSGETVALNITFPEDYSNNTDLAGKEAVFTVTVNYILEFNDETINTVENQYIISRFMMENFLCTDTITSAEELENAIKEGQRLVSIASYIVPTIIDRSEVTLNEEEAADYVSKVKEVYTKSAEDNGYKFEEVIPYYGFTDETQFTQYFTKMFRSYVILLKIAQDNNITTTEQEYQDFVNMMIKTTTSRQYLTTSDYEADYPKDATIDDLIVRKVYKYIVDTVTIVSDEEATSFESVTTGEETTEAAEGETGAEEGETTAEGETAAEGDTSAEETAAAETTSETAEATE